MVEEYRKVYLRIDIILITDIPSENFEKYILNWFEKNKFKYSRVTCIVFIIVLALSTSEQFYQIVLSYFSLLNILKSYYYCYYNYYYY